MRVAIIKACHVNWHRCQSGDVVDVEQGVASALIAEGYAKTCADHPPIETADEHAPEHATSRRGKKA